MDGYYLFTPVLVYLLTLIALSVTQVPKVAEIITLPYGQPCTNSSGTEIANGDEWRTPDGCDRNICRVGYYGNYTLRYHCRSIGVKEPPSTQVCYKEQDLTLSFPYCCPYVDCDERAPTTNPPTIPSCYDRASAFACNFWSSEGGCDPSNGYYQYTLNYCNLTCSFC